MAQRNPLNDRNTTDKTGGKTRKSAARAKPKREAAQGVRIQTKKSKQTETKSEKKARKQEQREKENKVYSVASVLMNEDENYRKWKRYWWVLMALAIGFTLATWLLQLSAAVPIQFTYVMLAGAYIGIIGALILDFAKVRPIRKKKRAEAADMSDKAMEKIIYEKLEADAEKKKNRDGKFDSFLKKIGINRKKSDDTKVDAEQSKQDDEER